MKANEVKLKTTIGEIYYRLNCDESKYQNLPNVRNDHDWDIVEAVWNQDAKQWTLVIKANIEPDEPEEAEDLERKEEADD